MNINKNNKINKNRAFIYARTASSSQIGHPISDQIEWCKKRVKGLRCSVADIFIDKGQSGMNINRPGIKKMLSECEKVKPEYVVAWDMTRISRSVCDYYSFKKYLETHGILLKFCTQRYLEDDILAESMTVALSEAYSKDLSRRIKRGLQAKKEREDKKQNGKK